MRAAAVRFQREGIGAGRGSMKWNALAGQSSSLCKALSVIGDRWTLLILNQCFLKLRRYGEIQSSLGLSKPLLAARPDLRNAFTCWRPLARIPRYAPIFFA